MEPRRGLGLRRRHPLSLTPSLPSLLRLPPFPYVYRQSRPLPLKLWTAHPLPKLLNWRSKTSP